MGIGNALAERKIDASDREQAQLRGDQPGRADAQHNLCAAGDHGRDGPRAGRDGLSAELAAAAERTASGPLFGGGTSARRDSGRRRADLRLRRSSLGLRAGGRSGRTRKARGRCRRAGGDAGVLRRLGFEAAGDGAAPDPGRPGRRKPGRRGSAIRAQPRCPGACSSCIESGACVQPGSPRRHQPADLAAGGRLRLQSRQEQAERKAEAVQGQAAELPAGAPTFVPAATVAQARQVRAAPSPGACAGPGKRPGRQGQGRKRSRRKQQLIRRPLEEVTRDRGGRAGI